MNFYATGQRDAFEKFAIAFKSPKMRSVFEGAVDQAYANGASPLLRRQALLPFQQLPSTGKSQTYDTAREVLRSSHFAGMRVSKARQAENAASLKGISLKKQLARYNESPHKKDAPSIGRPRENAINAMLTRPLQNIRDPQQTRSGRDSSQPRTRTPSVQSLVRDSRNQGLRFDGKMSTKFVDEHARLKGLLRDIHDVRHGHHGDSRVERVIDYNTLGQNAARNAATLEKHAPQQLSNLESDLYPEYVED